MNLKLNPAFQAILLFLIIGILSCGKKESPNIIFFFVDDMGWQETSVPFHSEKTSLNDRYQTPNMERLASEGLKFTQAYACALCSPSRVSLMTGANAARHQVTNWTLRKDKSPDWNHPDIQPPDWKLHNHPCR
jgi:arylsulfatase A-like enzyme